MKLIQRAPAHRQWGYADFFNDRAKCKILNLANAKPKDVLYDLGCGDASFLIFAVVHYGIQKAVGYENMPQRLGLAKRRVKHRQLADKITILGEDLNKEADLSDANVILDMLPQGSDDHEILYQKNIKIGTRIIKHDLPLIGFIPDRVDYPFYRHTIPLVKARSAREWASKVLLCQQNKSLADVWHELFYYGYEKAYSKWDIKDFMKIAAKRFR